MNMKLTETLSAVSNLENDNKLILKNEQIAYIIYIFHLLCFL